MQHASGIYAYTGPAISLIFTVAFTIAWFYQQQRRYILLFSLTFLAFAAASLSVIMRIPPSSGANAMVSAALYTFSILLLIEGVMARMKSAGADVLLFGIAGAIMVLLYYFFYFDRNVVMRIYIQNFGYGLMFVVAAVQIARTSSQRGVDRLIFWLFLIFGLHFFPRTILTLAASEQIYALNPRSPTFDAEAARLIFRDTPFWQVLNFSLIISSFLVALTLLGAVVADVIEDASREGGIDVLTGLANRRGFLRRVKAIDGDPARTSMSIVYCDLDRFKEINDTYGHLVGDQVLQHFGRLLEAEVRPQDVASRFGGEEFVILLMQANLAGAGLFAERVRQEVELTRFAGLPQHARVTASFGVAQWWPGEELLDVMNRADRLVYEAKRAGRNCIVAEPSRPGTGAAAG